MKRFLTVATLALSWTSHASTVTQAHHLDHPTMHATHMVIGHVSGKETQWYDARLLVTTYTVTTGEVIAGQAPATLTVTLPGGEWNGWTQHAVGVPLLASGDEVLLVTDDLANIPLRGVHRIHDDRILASELSHTSTIPASIEALRATVQQ